MPPEVVGGLDQPFHLIPMGHFAYCPDIEASCRGGPKLEIFDAEWLAVS
jgi:hypothetical protein